ncbi:hypothetical protein [Longimicrobium sp.]|uniref:hypothetical protein n=1 Tax=Longimicrobium sp. TaxID=2029185 RepID=UPI002E35094C|nr:hypothetical protein [Longimicrobium sp.]HEX6038624.1 hypothetical protein [Longimicrobium sp.]
MPNATKFRVSLAVITLAGAFHLNSAQASAPANTDCDSYAQGYAAGLCATKKQKPVGVVYTCNLDGTANIESVTCVTPT